MSKMKMLKKIKKQKVNYKLKMILKDNKMKLMLI